MRKSKYGNKKVEAFGLKFDSKGEYHRYLFLKAAQDDGLIHELKTQVPFKIVINDTLICKYIADFTYLKNETGLLVVEDFKGVETAIFKLKKKLMLASNGVDLYITKSPSADI